MASFRPAPLLLSLRHGIRTRACGIMLGCGGLALLGGCQSSRSTARTAPLPFVTRDSSDALSNQLASKQKTTSPQTELVDATPVVSSRAESDDSVQLASMEQRPDSSVPPPPSELPPTSSEKLLPIEEGEFGVTLSSLEQIALQNNPAIAQAAASAQKATGFRHQVGKYPNPVIGYSGQQLDDRGTDQHLAYVEQEIVTGKKLRLNEQVLDQEIQSQLWEVEAQRYRVLTDVRMRFYQTLAAQQRYELAKEFRTVASEGVRIAQMRKDALEGSIPEVLQAEIQLNEVDLIQQRAEIAVRTTWNELTAVAGVSGMQMQSLVGELRIDAPQYDWESKNAELAQNNPALIAARTRVHRAIANMSRQEVQAIPNLLTSLGAGYDNGTGSQMINVDIGIPLPVFNRNQGNISASHAEYCRATQDVRRIEMSLRQRFAIASRQYESAAVTVDRLEQQILPKAQQTLELSEKAYIAGEFEFLQVLVARRTYFDSNLQYNAALLELAETKTLIDGLMLTGGLDDTRDTDQDDSLRGQTLSGQ
ncbi:MAG TPA: TolC family protein [Planctomicrobium sp.]|nr:TolC family protein [Planctomicrobium sp.]